MRSCSPCRRFRVDHGSPAHCWVVLSKICLERSATELGKKCRRLFIWQWLAVFSIDFRESAYRAAHRDPMVRRKICNVYPLYFPFVILNEMSVARLWSGYKFFIETIQSHCDRISCRSDTLCLERSVLCQTLAR